MYLYVIFVYKMCEMVDKYGNMLIYLCRIREVSNFHGP